MEPVQTPVANNDEPFEPCPTPLSWQDVVRQFVDQSEQWSATIDGLELNGRSIGEGPPLYFVNGFMGDMNLLSLTIWLMSEEFRCVTFDWPNDFRPRDAHAFANVLMSVANQQSHETFSVFSTGAGCIATLAAMLKQPERIQRCVLHGGFAKCELSVTERAAMVAGSVFPGLIGALPGVTKILQQNHRAWFPPFDTSRWTFAEQNLGSTPVKRLARMATVLKSFEFTDRLDQIATQTLLVRCEGDSPIQEKAQNLLEKSISGVSVEWMHTCGRLPFLTHPHRLKKILLNFLSEPSAA